MDVNNSAQEVMTAIIDEAIRCGKKYGQPTSTHESMGVLLEEFAELRDAVRANDRIAIMQEAVQVAAAAYRLAWECKTPSIYFFNRSGFE